MTFCKGNELSLSSDLMIDKGLTAIAQEYQSSLIQIAKKFDIGLNATNLEELYGLTIDITL